MCKYAKKGFLDVPSPNLRSDFSFEASGKISVISESETFGRGKVIREDGPTIFDGIHRDS